MVTLITGASTGIGAEFARQFAALGHAVEHAGDAEHGLLQAGAFAAQVLRVFGVVPDVGAFQLPGYFLKTLFLRVVVKDTP